MGGAGVYTWGSGNSYDGEWRGDVYSGQGGGSEGPREGLCAGSGLRWLGLPRRASGNGGFRGLGRASRGLREKVGHAAATCGMGAH